MNNLPSGYEYKLVENDEKRKTLAIRVKNVTNAELAKDFLKKYQKDSKTTWRVARTHKSSGIFNLFRVDYRCHLNTDKRFRCENSKKTKNTGCPATLKMTIHRYFEVEGLRSPSEDAKEYPLCIEMNYNHNHTLNSVAALKYKHISSEIKEANGFSNTKVYHLDSSVDLRDEDADSDLEGFDLRDEDTDSDLEGFDLRDDDTESDSEDFDLQVENTDSDLEEFDLLVNRIKTYRKENPAAFKPAIIKMTENAKKFASTETEMLAAMHSFSRNFGPTTSSLEQTTNKKQKMSVQPIAVAGRKCIADSKISIQRLMKKKEEKEHDFSIFSNAPSKQKSSPNLIRCVFSNVFIKTGN